ncbi:MAG TPA: DUF2269 family protein [Rhodobacteraceae bacterium]|nr:DUF2269 family protein [Paracoccaceae bacterium]
MGYFGLYAAQFLDYSTLKIIHMFGIIVFLGNIIITGWWKTLADKTGDYRIIAFAQRQVTLTDWIFTLGGVVLVLLGGLGMVAHLNENVMDEIHSTKWLGWGYYLFLLSGVIWVVILIPLQIIQAKMARKFAKTGDIPERYWLYGKLWLYFGILAILIPLVNLYWMVFKP